MVSKIVLTCAFLIAPSIVAIAQTSIEFDFGVRGGAFNSGIPLEVFSNHYFPPAYSTDKMPYRIRLLARLLARGERCSRMLSLTGRRRSRTEPCVCINQLISNYNLAAPLIAVVDFAYDKDV